MNRGDILLISLAIIVVVSGIVAIFEKWLPL
jgi:hypothetical protein